MNLLYKLAEIIILIGIVYAFGTILSFIITAAWSIFPLLFVGAVIFILYREHHGTKNN